MLFTMFTMFTWLLFASVYGVNIRVNGSVGKIHWPHKIP